MHKGYDIPGFSQQSAWAGANSFPFGLFGCEGWIAHARQLTNVVTALNRAPGARSRYSLISFLPYSQGEFCVIRYSQHGSCSMRDARFMRAMHQAQGRCLRCCQVCGRPALPLICGGVFCVRHAPKQFSFEVLCDARQIKRSRRGWRKVSRATILGYSKEHVQGACMSTYSIQGRYYLRTQDAPPGGRQQAFEHLVESGLVPEDIGGEWVFPIARPRMGK